MRVNDKDIVNTWSKTRVGYRSHATDSAWGSGALPDAAAHMHGHIRIPTYAVSDIPSRDQLIITTTYNSVYVFS